jgi:hypothetical protein
LFTKTQTRAIENSVGKMLLKLNNKTSRFQRLRFTSKTSQQASEHKEKQADKLYHVVKDMVHLTKCVLIFTDGANLLSSQLNRIGESLHEFHAQVH